jgi:hypothetical protein
LTDRHLPFPAMDALSIAMGIAMFAILLGLIYGIDRV